MYKAYESEARGMRFESDFLKLVVTKSISFIHFLPITVATEEHYDGGRRQWFVLIDFIILYLPPLSGA